MDSGGWDFDVMTLKKNASHSSYDEYGYGIENTGGSGKFHLGGLQKREQSYNSLRSNKSSHSNTSSPSITYRNNSSSSASSASSSTNGGGVTITSNGTTPGTNSFNRKLQIRNALLRAESDMNMDGCKESKYIDTMLLVSLDGTSEVKQDAKEIMSPSLLSFSSSSPSTSSGLTTNYSELYSSVQSLQKILDRNHKIPPSELYHGVIEPTMNELERLTDEMKGDSEATRQETKKLISLLKYILMALDKHTDSGLISSFISTIIGFSMDDDCEEDLEEEDDDEENSDQNQS